MAVDNKHLSLDDVFGLAFGRGWCRALKRGFDCGLILALNAEVSVVEDVYDRPVLEAKLRTGVVSEPGLGLDVKSRYLQQRTRIRYIHRSAPSSEPFFCLTIK